MGIALFSSLNKTGVSDAAQQIREWAATPELAQALAEAHRLAQAEESERPPGLA
jgi:GTP-binding protein